MKLSTKTRRYKKEQLKKAFNAWGNADTNALTTILARLTPVMSVDAFKEHMTNHFNKCPLLDKSRS